MICDILASRPLIYHHAMWAGGYYLLLQYKGTRRNFWIGKHKSDCARSAREMFEATPIFGLALGESSSENGETVVQQWELSFFIVKM